MSCCSISSASPTKYFLNLSRFFFGIWLLWVGLEKTGYFTPDPNDSLSGFIYGYLAPTFKDTVLPSFLVILTGWLIALGEPILGLALLIGRRLRCVWTLVSLLMFTLLFGQTLLHEHASVNNIWFYLVFAIVNGALAGSCNTSCCDISCRDETSCEDSCETSYCDTKTECCSSEKTCCDTKSSCSTDKKDSCC